MSITNFKVHFSRYAVRQVNVELNVAFIMSRVKIVICCWDSTWGSHLVQAKFDSRGTGCNFKVFQFRWLNHLVHLFFLKSNFWTEICCFF